MLFVSMIAPIVHKIVSFCFQSGHSLFKKWGYDSSIKTGNTRAPGLSTQKHPLSISLLSKTPQQERSADFQRGVLHFPQIQIGLFRYEFVGRGHDPADPVSMIHPFVFCKKRRVYHCNPLHYHRQVVGGDVSPPYESVIDKLQFFGGILVCGGA